MQTTNVLLLLILIVLLIGVACMATKIFLEYLKVKKNQEIIKTFSAFFMQIFSTIFIQSMSRSNPAAPPPPAGGAPFNPFANMFPNGQNPFTGEPLDDAFFERFRPSMPTHEASAAA